MKKHTSYRGQKIDMEMLKFQHQYSVAVGNANMNARGDIIGRGGTVVKKREELLAERERELQKPDISPEHQSHSMAPQMGDPMAFADDGFDDTQFESSSTGEPIEEPVEKKAPVKRARTKDTDAE
ncbi:hypothetical protein pEaSNUABM50_00323 [Erwinia phage pEa_SNUABM_50]|uniref:Uncharacterized protein n=4 Tax=Eneladusvirus BF TaxID=2560751 RepID=A0A7L8ZNI6_9CAUD|nr:hypothetical protein FDH34_gp327 [Serratia phage BF]QOI71264.1 hypothetical protein pEaSNUABM12_00326 [Erwinia phage pEa_SNUABM_12]QOI71808.1 hypothetical protein pEaSNUABM47_00324 [Erwinia phage pEa_SNUABM_47]QOI72347.1 hypothetical protein pEaSNUABM50_00323 [Erwinia phage pEa_SNUABM_50]QXO11473.1 hypothetical protein pEaSNUABM19_00327 [Erwinia phage pEa_SNUABM_19]QXO12021.1 hypothetical protein pEaSNUABM44_00325 [Erwinia phage pEa_SNUABM_44]QXO12574.1 hypothetical protein pEaSNUABM49_003